MLYCHTFFLLTILTIDVLLLARSYAFIICAFIHQYKRMRSYLFIPILCCKCSVSMVLFASLSDCYFIIFVVLTISLSFLTKTHIITYFLYFSPSALCLIVMGCSLSVCMILVISTFPSLFASFLPRLIPSFSPSCVLSLSTFCVPYVSVTFLLLINFMLPYSIY